MKHITSTFLKGLFTLLPLLLSIYLFFWFLAGVEGFSHRVLLAFWPAFLYIPGMGVLVACILIYLFGTIVDRPLTKWAFHALEALFSELPIVKTVYNAIKDFTRYLQPGHKRHNQVVLVKFPNAPIEMIGLMTRESLEGLPEPVTKEGRVSVYFPMSYQFGGCTLFIPAAWVSPTSMSVEEAMRSIITAWLPGEGKKLGPL